MRRFAVLLALVGVGLGVTAGPTLASSSDDQFAVVRARVAEAQVLVDEAVAAAAAGDREQAYDLARTAYLDHFELAEVPLRLRDPNLVLDLELAFAKLRNGIRDGAPLSEIRGSAREIEAGLVDVDRTLADKGFAAPLLAFVFSFTILFREGIEVVLLLAILLGTLSAGRASGYRKPLAGGVLAALAATAVTWVLATVVLEIAPVQRELLEGLTAVAAVVVLFAVSFWLVSRLSHKHWLEFMRARVGCGDLGRAARRPSRRSASRPSTARASRPCSSTRRSGASRPASSSTSCSASSPPWRRWGPSPSPCSGSAGGCP